MWGASNGLMHGAASLVPPGGGGGNWGGGGGGGTPPPQRRAEPKESLLDFRVDSDTITRNGCALTTLL